MFHLDSGKRIEVTDFAMPSSLNESEIAQYLDDIYHEASKSGDVIVRIE